MTFATSSSLVVAVNPVTPATPDMLTATVVASALQVAATATDETIPTGFWRVAISNGSIVVALDGTSTASAVTSDGVTWTYHASSIYGALGWQTGMYGAGKFIAFAGGYNVAAVSTDNGVTFNAQTVPNLNYFSSAYGNGLYVAFAQSGTPAIAISSDTVSWSTQNSPLSTGIGASTFGNGVFCIIGTGSTPQCATSTDGVTWTVGTMPTLGGSGGYLGVVYGNGVFVAGTNDAHTAVSSDGITWTLYSTGLAGNVRYITFNGVVFVGADASTVAGTSLDGITWTGFSLASSQAWDNINSLGSNCVMTAQSSAVSELITTTVAYPTGTVQFLDGVSVLGTQSLPGTATSQSVNISPSFAAGSHSLTAVYSGDTYYGTSTSSPVILTVYSRATTTALTVTPSTVNVGDTATLVAVVSPTGGASTPTGTVTFNQNGTPIATVSLSGGSATLGTSFDTAGTYTLTATYNGDVSHDASTSPGESLTVVGLSITTTTLVVGQNPIAVGIAEDLTATVVGATMGASGTITFYDGTTVIGSSPYSGSSVSISVNFTNVGTHALVAQYSGDSANLGSSSTIQTTYVVANGGSNLPNTYIDLITSEYRG